MITIQLTDDEFHLLRHAVTAFLADFGHDEKDVRADVKALLAKLDTR